MHHVRENLAYECLELAPKCDELEYCTTKIKYVSKDRRFQHTAIGIILHKQIQLLICCFIMNYKYSLSQ